VHGVEASQGVPGNQLRRVLLNRFIDRNTKEPAVRPVSVERISQYLCWRANS
jgi:hypothetical protein